MTTQTKYRQWQDAHEACLNILVELRRLYILVEWSKEEDQWVDQVQESLTKLEEAIKK